MDIASGLLQGFALALQPVNLLWCFIGVLLGTVVGIMPGLGPPATIAMLLPLTLLMNPTSAIIMLAGIYYGAKYGGSTTSILLNVPGESASVVTCFDGYQMARNGRAGAALGIAAIASFIAGTVGVLGLMLIAPPLSKMALAFSSPEYFGLMALGLAMVVLLGALVLWGFKPGPLFIPENPALFWGLVASMYIGNVMLLLLNLPLVPLFAQALRTPGFVLYPLILGVSIVGVYSAAGSVFDLGLLAGFGLLGYLMR